MKSKYSEIKAFIGNVKPLFFRVQPWCPNTLTSPHSRGQRGRGRTLSCSRTSPWRYQLSRALGPDVPSSKTSKSVTKPGRWLEAGSVVTLSERGASTVPMGCWQRRLAESSGATHNHRVSGTVTRPQAPSKHLGVTILPGCCRPDQLSPALTRSS